MRTFVDILFTSTGKSPADVARYIKKKVGFTFIRGKHDIVFEWQSDEEFLLKVEILHSTMKELGVIYKLYTPVSDDDELKIPKVIWYPDNP